MPEIARIPLEETRAATGPSAGGAVTGKITGGRHLFAALGYSLAGAVRLFRETAFRHELLMAGCLIGLFGYADAPFNAFMVLGVLLLALFAFEAINTAIEEIVDRISPEWSQTGRNAKDLGSFAVLCMLVANAFYAAAVLFPAFMG